jgi:hypothetical protein
VIAAISTNTDSRVALFSDRRFGQAKSPSRWPHPEAWPGKPEEIISGG